jgi:hypothetical protein
LHTYYVHKSLNNACVRLENYVHYPKHQTEVAMIRTSLAVWCALFLASVAVTTALGSDVREVQDWFRDVPIPIATTVCGNVSGTWTLAGSPYEATCDLTIPLGQTLTIEPGVIVKFRGHYKFTILGTITAIGTEQDSIIFTRARHNDASRWWGLRFSGEGSNASQLAYCVIEYGRATGGHSDYGSTGGGIQTIFSSPEVRHCTIRNNTAEYAGGGICCYDGTALFSHCVITGNEASFGGGLNLWHSAATFENCTVSGNFGSSDGGALRIGQSTALLRNTIFSHSVGTGITFAAGGPYGSFDHCDISANSMDNLSGDIPTGVGALDHTNANGDPCDVFYNILLAPRFTNPNRHNYHLRETSPCINAGNPASPHDPDGTVADIGAFPFGHTQGGTNVCGEISGRWTPAHSPYFVTCDVTVPTGQSLIIEPGVQVRFRGHYKFEVNGVLRAIGTPTDSILFTRDYPTEEAKWFGIRFWYAQPGCSLSYCIVEYGKADGAAGWYDAAGGGVFSLACSPTMLHCTLRYNWARDGGGGWHNDAGSPYIADCLVHDNVTAYYGGGISGWHSNPTIERTVMIHNTGVVGGGFAWGQGAPVVRNCTIANNTASQMGAGMLCWDACISNFNMTSCIIANNTGIGVSFVEPGNNVYHLRYNDIFGNTGGNFAGNTPPGLGVLDHTNANGDPCDQFYNIILNPHFVNAAASNYHLTAESPCIDAGDPALPHDPDNSVADIGAFFFDHGDNGQAPTTPSANPDLITSNALAQNYPNPFNPATSISFDLLESGNVSLKVYNLMGQQVAELINSNLGAGHHVVQFNAENLPSGVYLYRLRAGQFTAYQKMLLMK